MFMGAEYYNRNEVASTTVMLDTMTMIVMEDFKSRLRTTRKAAGMSQAGLGKLVGMSQSGMPCPVEHGQRTYVLRVRGHAMCATHGRRSFQEGDVIFVDPDRPAGNESFVIVRLSANSEPIFRQLLIEDGGCQYLRALNPAWPEPITRLDGGHRIEGTVIFKGEALI